MFASHRCRWTAAAIGAACVVAAGFISFCERCAPPGQVDAAERHRLSEEQERLQSALSAAVEAGKETEQELRDSRENNRMRIREYRPQDGGPRQLCECERSSGKCICY